MAITGINNSSYTSYYASNYKNTVKKTDSEKDSTNTKDGNVTTSTVELKTSRPGVTKTEQIKTGYSNVNDYSKYLQGKYHYVNTGTTSMQGVPTTVSVSSAFLQKCMNDPEKAKYLEENLAAIPDCAKSAVNGCLGTLTNLSYNVDENGNISVAISGTNDPDGKIAKENAERKAKENREKEKKVKEKRAAKKGGNNEYYNAGTARASSNYADVRNLINTGRFQEAEQILNGIPFEGRDAEWYFLNGVIMSNKGWLDDAYNSFQTACQMDPSNKEYNAAYNRMKNRRNGSNGGYNRGGGPVFCCTPCDICTSLACADCFCDCCCNSCR